MREHVQTSMELRQVLDTMATRYKDPVALWALHRVCGRYPERDDFSDNYWDFRPDDGQWTFLPGPRVKAIREDNAERGNWALSADMFFRPTQLSLRVATKPVRGIVRLVDIFKNTDDRLDVSDADLSRFSDNWRAVMRPMDVTLVDGEELRTHYQGVEGSCMSYESCQPYLDVYVETPGVKLAVVLNDNGETVCRGHYGCGPSQGRALVWEFADGLTMMDRQYGDYTVKNALRDYGIRQGWLVKNHDNDTWHLPNGDVTSNLPSDLRGKIKKKLKRDDFQYMPYGDTMRYWCRSCDTLMRKASHDECGECGGDVVVLDGTSGDDHSNWYATSYHCETCGYVYCQCQYCDHCHAEYHNPETDECPNMEACNVCDERTHIGEECEHCSAQWCDACREWYEEDEDIDGCTKCTPCVTCGARWVHHLMFEGQCQRCSVTMMCNHCHTRVRPIETMMPISNTVPHIIPEVTDDITCPRCDGLLDQNVVQRLWRTQFRRSCESARVRGMSVTYHPAPISAWDIGGRLRDLGVTASNETIRDYRCMSPPNTVAGAGLTFLDRLAQFRSHENHLREEMERVREEVIREKDEVEGEWLSLIDDRVLAVQYRLNDAISTSDRFIRTHMQTELRTGIRHRSEADLPF